MTWESLASIIGAVAGSQVLTTYIQAKFNKNKVAADTAQVLVEKTLQWASSLTARIEALEKELNDRHEEIANLKRQIAHLEACKLDK